MAVGGPILVRFGVERPAFRRVGLDGALLS